METGANITNMTNVSFADFETKTNDGNGNFDSYAQCQDKQEIGMTLDLSLGQKGEQLFATDQTPTPTRLIKNCEEVGLFDDLNPFDYDFLKAAQINADAGSVAEPPKNPDAAPTDGDSLHTPQVYPPEISIASEAEPAARQNSSTLEDLLATPTLATATELVTQANDPPPLQLIQPPVISLVAVPISTIPSGKPVPKQVVRPFLLPKPSTAVNSKASSGTVLASTTPVHEPSSASQTPTSQLPIKERLKAILNNSNNNNRRQKSFPVPEPKVKSAVKRNEDCMERRRAAATRYRDKMRNAHKQLKEQNVQLQQENRKLKERVAALERALQQQSNNNNIAAVGNQIQLAPSSIHLVINVPKMIVPSSLPGQRPA